jgi:hypothetical protein
MALKVETFKYGVRRLLCMSDLLAQLRLSRTDMCQETAEEAISQFLLKMYMAVHATLNNINNNYINIQENEYCT